MGRRKVQDPKRPKTISILESKLERYIKATEKMGLDSLNKFMELAADGLADEALQDSPKREIPTVSELLEAQQEAIAALTKEVRGLKSKIEVNRSVRERQTQNG